MMTHEVQAAQRLDVDGRVKAKLVKADSRNLLLRVSVCVGGCVVADAVVVVVVDDRVAQRGRGALGR